MKPLRYHLGLATSVVIAGYILFTFFPHLLPPEDMSPFVYTAALVLCAQVWLGLPGKKKWLYLPVLLLCLLALLDEAGYGSEVIDIAPYYSARHNTEIRDLHNALEIGRQLFVNWLEEQNWQGMEFLKFAAKNSLLVLGGFLFPWWLRRQAAGRSLAVWRGKLVETAPLIQLALGILAAAWLLALPADAKNAVLAGYSVARLALVASILAASAWPFTVLRKIGPAQIQTKLSGIVKAWGGILAGVAALVIALGLAYQLYTPFIFYPDQRVQLERLTPFVMWLAASAGLLLLSLLAWGSKFRQSASQWLQGAGAWLRSEPAFIYAAYAVLIILVAQLIDQELIPLNEMIQPTGRIPLWGLWTEEVFELLAGVLFFLAGAFFNSHSIAAKEIEK